MKRQEGRLLPERAGSQANVRTNVIEPNGFSGRGIGAGGSTATYSEKICDLTEEIRFHGLSKMESSAGLKPTNSNPPA